MWSWIIIVTVLVASGVVIYFLVRRGAKAGDGCCGCPAELREKCAAVKGSAAPPPECPSPPQ